MTKPIIRIHNSETNEVTDREMTDTEYSNYQAAKIKADEDNKKAQTKADEKSALLSRLGITEDEARLLLF